MNNSLNKSRRIQSATDSNSQLRTILLASLAKLHQQSTAATGYSELRALIAQLQTNQFVILTNLLDSNDISKLAKKDYIKVFGVLAEIRGSDIQEQLPRIVQIINKRIYEGDSSFIQVISDTFANINEFTIQTSPIKFDLFSQVTEILQQNFHHNNKVAQQISAQALCRIIQTSDSSVLETVSKTYTQKTLEILKSPHCKTQQGLLESLLSLILTVEEIFEPSLEDCVHTVQTCLNSEEWNARKIAVDIIYTLSVIFPHYFRANEQCTIRISELRFDKIKHVRDAASIAMTQLKGQSQISAREHKSVFKSSANKEFFERSSDIQIVENRPRDQELAKQQNLTADLLVKNETFQESSNKKQSPYQLLSDSKALTSPSRDLNPYIQPVLQPDRFSNSQEKFVEQYRYQGLNQSQELPQKQHIKSQSKQDLLKLYDSAKAKQNEIFQQIISSRIQASEVTTKQELVALHKRIDNIEQMLQKISQNLDQQQQFQQQHEPIYDSLNKPQTPLKNIFFVAPKTNPSNVQTESKLGESNFEVNSGKISDNNHQRSTSEASPTRNRDFSLDSKLIKDQKFLEQQKIMRKVEEQLDKDNVNEAYNTALTSLDDQIIISTMMKTGPCAERLDSTQVEFLLHKLRTLDWIENSLQHHLKRMPAMLLKSISTQLNQVQQNDQVKRIQELIQNGR